MSRLLAATLLGLCALSRHPRRRLQARPRLDGTAGRPQGEGDQAHVEEQDLPGTVRDYWVYVPAQYDGKKPACVMVFQDGGSYVNAKGQFRVPIVFDNLIHKKEMPVTIGIFINPGTVPPAEPRQEAAQQPQLRVRHARPTSTPASWRRRSCPRSARSTSCARTPPAGRSAASAPAASAPSPSAWERPDLFSKVLSHVGSFTNIRGGDVYPGLIRKTEQKPIRVFLQDGSGDLDNLHGNWPLANQQMAAALKFAKYDYQLRVRRRRPQRQARRRHPARLARWLWRDTPAPAAATQAKPAPAPARRPSDASHPRRHRIPPDRGVRTRTGHAAVRSSAPGEVWQRVPGLSGVLSLVGDGKGTVYAGEPATGRITAIDPSGNAKAFATVAGLRGMSVGLDGKLYVCQRDKRRLVTVEGPGQESTVAADLAVDAVVVTRAGRCYVTVPDEHAVYAIESGGKKSPRSGRNRRSGLSGPVE